MKILLSTLIFFLFTSCEGQNIYEKNKEELSNCISCKPRPELKYPNHDYVQTDLARYREMFNPITELKPKVSDYLKIYPELLTGNGNTITKTVELLDGLEFVNHKFFGGYNNFSLEILIYNDLIIYTRLFTEVEYHIFENIYLKEIKVPLTCSGRGMEYYKIHKSNLKDYQRIYPLFTLEIDNDRYEPENLNAYYNMNQIEWNYDTFQVAEDYTHLANGFIKTLLKNKEYDLIEKLLFGLNPVGRIYAFTALNIAKDKGYKPTDEIKEQMKKVEQNGLKFVSGRLTSHSQTRDIDFKNRTTFE